ncbi:MAG: glycoside hydrolase family 2 TIM barrel-domain containing protein [Verrucomicrobiota bacterium]
MTSSGIGVLSLAGIFAATLASGLSQATAVASSDSVRLVLPLKTDWRFTRKNADIADTSSGWDAIDLPHTWNAQDGQAGPAEISPVRESPEQALSAFEARAHGQSGPINPHLKSGYYRGACWYERALDIPAEWKGIKRVFLRVGAASTVARTFINKTLLGEHRGGFTAFAYELTDHLNYGEVNELRIQVDNTHREDMPPLSGDFNIFGGLYRSVELIVTDLICVSPLDYASDGVYLTPVDINDQEAFIEVRTVIFNGLRANKEAKVTPTTPVILETMIADADGRPVARSTKTFHAPQSRAESFTQMLALPAPRRWNGRKDPYLYTATVRVLTDGRPVDQVVQKLGLRSCAITQEQGFLLNGKPYPVHGVNRHQDKRNQGWALSVADEELDASLIRELGATAVRNAHYPQSESWHNITDREGLLVWDEISLVNEVRAAREFWGNSEDQLREMVHQLYNHPSVIWWGIFNELENTQTHYIPPSGPELARMLEIIKELDPRRIPVGVSDRIPRYFNHIPEQIGFNMYPGWYGDSDPSNPVDLTSILASRYQEVGKRISISEYGAGGNIAHHTEGPVNRPAPTTAPFHPEEWQTFVHEHDWAQIKTGQPQLWGAFIWNMFDFAVNGRDEGNISFLNDKGLVTHDRQFRKDAFFFYKANWTTEPMVYLTSRRATPRTRTATDIKVFSNCPEIVLSVNHQVIGQAKPDTQATVIWPAVALKPGENLIEVASLGSASPAVTDSCVWVLQPAASP